MAGQIIARGERVSGPSVHGTRPGHQERPHIYKTIHGTKADAQRCLNELLLKKDLGGLRTLDPRTVKRYLDDWLGVAAKPRLRESTCRDHKWLIEKYVTPALGPKRPHQLTPVRIQAESVED